MVNTDRLGAVRQFTDVFAAILVLVLANVLLLIVPAQVQLVVAVAVLFVLPGYAVTTFVFPSRPEQSVVNPLTSATQTGAIGDKARAALSFGLSFTLLAVLGIAMNMVGIPLETESMLLVVTGITILALLGGVVRRVRTPLERRYSAPFEHWGGSMRDGLRGDRIDVVLNVALAVVLVAAMSSFAVALTSPQNGYNYTEASLLTETPDGELVAGNYPTEFGPDGRADLVLQVTNNEGEPVVYSVVVQLQQLEADDDGVRQVTSRTELTREANRVDDGETWTHDHTVAPTLFGEDLRLVYLIYVGTPPSNPTTENAYRYLSLSIDVADPE